MKPFSDTAALPTLTVGVSDRRRTLDRDVFDGIVVGAGTDTPVAAHVAMHIAAVLHGMDTTVQLPPHS